MTCPLPTRDGPISASKSNLDARVCALFFGVLRLRRETSSFLWGMITAHYVSDDLGGLKQALRDPVRVLLTELRKGKEEEDACQRLPKFYVSQ